MHPHQTSTSKLSGFGQVGAGVDDISWTERALNQDIGPRNEELLLPVLQDHMCTLLSDGIHRSLEVSADL